ncbi:MAG: CinA family protein [Gammaproteobacteria bacterium]|nr:CinA family protein [Gammaproteobacteria bacterium]
MTDLTIKLAARLPQHGYRLVTAESCTGGLIAAACTALPGSSLWFERGLVTYSNSAKESLLAVSPETLRAYGAVSEETVAAMVRGAVAGEPSIVAVAVSGIAGPGGGTPRKPVGTVCLGWQWPGEGVLCRTFHFSGDRSVVRTQAVMAALRGIVELAQ